MKKNKVTTETQGPIQESHLKKFFRKVVEIDGLIYEQRDIIIQAGYELSRDEWREGFKLGTK